MASFLAKQIPTLTKAVARDEIPAPLRKSTNGRRRTQRSGAKRSGRR